MPIKWLAPGSDFPDVELATPEGLLAVGGDFNWQRILQAYSLGIFPWSNPDDPILWWSPDPRYVIFPDELNVKRSMRPLINQRRFKVTYDTQFEVVIEACRTSMRQGQEVGSWITPDLAQGYIDLHKQGFAHSVEVWTPDGKLAGGLYGVAIGKIFCGESMFTNVTNASKYGFIHLVKNLRRRGYWLIDCQMPTDHLLGLGASAISRREFTRTLQLNAQESTDQGSWTSLFSDDALDDKLPTSSPR